MKIQPTSGYALKAKQSAERLGLGFQVYSYPSILATVSPGADPIQRCCEVTETEYGEQLKFALASDIHLDGFNYGHPAIGVVSFNDRIDFRRMAEALINRGIYKELKINKFSTRKADPAKLRIDPGYIGINRNAEYPVVNFSASEERMPSYAPIPYVFDPSIQKLHKICFPTGKGKADELIVVSSDAPLEDRLESFLAGFIGKQKFIFDEIRQK